MSCQDKPNLLVHLLQADGASVFQIGEAVRRYQAGDQSVIQALSPQAQAQWYGAGGPPQGSSTMCIIVIILVALLLAGGLGTLTLYSLDLPPFGPSESKKVNDASVKNAPTTEQDEIVPEQEQSTWLTKKNATLGAAAVAGAALVTSPWWLPAKWIPSWFPFQSKPDTSGIKPAHVAVGIGATAIIGGALEYKLRGGKSYIKRGFERVTERWSKGKDKKDSIATPGKASGRGLRASNKEKAETGSRKHVDVETDPNVIAAKQHEHAVGRENMLQGQKNIGKLKEATSELDKADRLQKTHGSKRVLQRREAGKLRSAADEIAQDIKHQKKCQSAIDQANPSNLASKQLRGERDELVGMQRNAIHTQNALANEKGSIADAHDYYINAVENQKEGLKKHYDRVKADVQIANLENGIKLSEAKEQTHQAKLNAFQEKQRDKDARYNAYGALFDLIVEHEGFRNNFSQLPDALKGAKFNGIKWTPSIKRHAADKNMEAIDANWKKPAASKVRRALEDWIGS